MCSDPMRGNWELWHLSRPEQFFAYCLGYLRAALRNELVEEDQDLPFEWPDAAASLMLLAHAVELFLKGAILHRASILETTHDLRRLKAQYDALFPEDEFRWQLPFHTEYMEMSHREIAQLQKKEPKPSILYRYPEDFYGQAWRGVFGYKKSENTPWDIYGEIIELQRKVLRT